MHTDLCQPLHSVSVPANRLLLCSGVNSCLGAEARRPGRYVLRVCCSPSPALPCSPARNFNDYLGALCARRASLSTEMSSSKTQHILALRLRSHGSAAPKICIIIFRATTFARMLPEFNILTFNLQIFERKPPRSFISSVGIME